ncbi:glycosyltransferase [Epilithonimonas sp. JDS]|uniref:glycosyltransferase n=1 Tax=Epilithonimonas sp. JDS TaxID=2902797 RepID=UPI001E332ECD|nr:glycosyltransferase [Epilithonimonas sp. JDS]MCD9854178.1 glycosyltransferase [Epilithonimonas sp. JDS]
MENLPLVSVLCLCYNQEKFITESLESIKSQSYKSFEILICDDSSKDGSVAIIESWIQKNPDLKIIFIKHQQNKGITKTLNELLQLSSGKYIQLLALDDILMPDKFENHVKILENSLDNEVMVFSDAHLIDDDSMLYQNKFIARHMNYLSLKSENYFEKLLTVNFIPAMSALIKKQAIENLGGWDEDLSYEDHDMWLRLSKENNFIFSNQISCSYRLHANNSHKKRSVINESAIFKTFIKHKENGNVRDLIFKNLESIYLQNALSDEHQLFFSHYPVKSFPEWLIKNNFNTTLYRITKKIKKIINL